MYTPIATGLAIPEPIEWREGVSNDEWDHALALLRGHPLQSALWGEARGTVERMRDHRWMAIKDGTPFWMMRFEERRLPGVGRIAWAPRGPTGNDVLVPPEGLAERLRLAGFALLVTDPWVQVASETADKPRVSTKPRTIWVNLEIGEEAVWNALHPQMRKGVRRADRGNVIVEATEDARAISSFVALCAATSRQKGFDLRTSEGLIRALLEKCARGSGAEAVLFVARHGSAFGSGLFTIRVGTSVHQIWGATNRDLRQERVGEAVQWAAMKWAFKRGCTLYDLEGIDPLSNRSVYEFKRRLGGDEVTLAGKQYLPLSACGRIVAWFDVRFR